MGWLVKILNYATINLSPILENHLQRSLVKSVKKCWTRLENSHCGYFHYLSNYGLCNDNPKGKD